MHPLRLLYILGLTLLMSVVANAQNPRPDCPAKCAQQFALLLDLNDHTPVRLIEQAFGVPVKELRNKDLKLVVYRGIREELLILSTIAASKRVAIAVIGRHLEPTAPATVPTPLLWSVEPRTLDQVNMKFAITNCSGKVEHTSSKLDLAWTPSCYFGGPGSYKEYSFLFYMNGADCDKTIEDQPFEFSELKCQNLKNALPAIGQFIALDVSPSLPPILTFDALLAVISDFVLWGTFK